MYSSCVVEERRFSAAASWPMVLRSWRRTRILYHRSASWRRAENGVEAGLALAEEWVMVDLGVLSAMAGEDGLVLDRLCERRVQKTEG